MKYYLDSSVIVELIKGESRAQSIISKLEGDPVSSQLGRTETIRTIMRFYPEWIEEAYQLIEGITFLDIDRTVLWNVEKYGTEIELKTADAIHVSTAELLLDENDFFITFDKKMVVGAQQVGLRVITS